MKKVTILTLLFALVICAPAFANDIATNAASSEYAVKAPAMLVRGLTNIVLSPVEIIGHTYKGTVEGKPVLGTFEGLGEGLFWGLDRAGRGVWDVVTFLVPNYNGAPPTHGLHLLGKDEMASA